jgi:hypothetical protein
VEFKRDWNAGFIWSIQQGQTDFVVGEWSRRSFDQGRQAWSWISTSLVALKLDPEIVAARYLQLCDSHQS